MGHEKRFLPSRVSAGFLLRKETIAGRRRNGRDAPIADHPGRQFPTHRGRFAGLFELGEECRSVLQINSVEPRGEPAIDWLQ